MTNRLDRIAEKLGATFVDDVPVVGGGAFGAALLAGIVAELQMRLKPGQGIRPGRPSHPTWIETPKVPMSEATFLQLTRLAERASRSGRKVSPINLRLRSSKTPLLNFRSNDRPWALSLLPH